MNDQRNSLSRRTSELKKTQAELKTAQEAYAALEASHKAEVCKLEEELKNAKESASEWEEMVGQVVSKSSDYAWRVFLACQEKEPLLPKAIFDSVPIPEFEGGE